MERIRMQCPLDVAEGMEAAEDHLSNAKLAAALAKEAYAAERYGETTLLLAAARTHLQHHHRIMQLTDSLQ